MSYSSYMRSLLMLSLMSAAFSCMVPDITLDDAKCDAAAQCVEGWVCDPATRRCVVENECACVEAVPADWLGPFYLVTTPAGTDVGPCPGGDEGITLHRDPPPPETGCYECACGEADGDCFPAALQCAEIECSGAEPFESPVGQCTQFLVGTVDCRLAGDGGFEGACAPQQIGEPALPGWQTDLTLCELAVDARCGAERCANPALEARVCIRKDEEADCPASWDDERVVAHAGAEDTRSCTACSCAPATAVCDPGSYELYGSLSSCENDDFIAVVEGTRCGGPYENVEYIRAVADPTPEGASCEPQGGAIEGEFLPSDPVTLCCRAQ